MGDWCREAGLEGKNSHRVRKAAATRAAENGATTHALMAQFGRLVSSRRNSTPAAERNRLARENVRGLDKSTRTLDPMSLGAGELI